MSTYVVDKMGFMFQCDHQIQSIVFIMSVLGNKLDQIVALRNILQSLIDLTRVVVFAIRTLW